MVIPSCRIGVLHGRPRLSLSSFLSCLTTPHGLTTFTPCYDFMQSGCILYPITVLTPAVCCIHKPFTRLSTHDTMHVITNTHREGNRSLVPLYYTQPSLPSGPGVLDSCSVLNAPVIGWGLDDPDLSPLLPLSL